MTLNDISNTRLINQQIAEKRIETVKDLVSWMGAMQAQDFNMVKWAVGLRLPNSTHKTVENAIDNGEIIRTHVLRPTWHLVSADDIYWMLELTAPRIKASLKSRHKELELTESIFSKSRLLIEQALSGNKHLIREDLLTEFKKAKINVDDSRGNHILFWAELNGVICSGAIKNKKQTYALLEEWVPKKKPVNREEALAKLAHKYFSSHAPATAQDFAWWSGLPLTAARQAVELVKMDFVTETWGSQTYWLSNNFSSTDGTDKEAVYLLPAFDEFLISYKDRGATLAMEHHNKAVSNNGIFRPIIVVDGMVTGIWKRTIKKEKVMIETAFFRPHSKVTKALMEQKSLAFGDFLGKKAEISYRDA